MTPLAAAQLAGARLDRYFHACAFFHSRDEEYRVMAPFVREGLEGGEKAIHITDPQRRPDHLARLGASGIDTQTALESGQMQVLSWDETYLSGGKFDPESMLGLLEAALQLGREEGFPRTRIIGHMEWALEERPGVQRLLEYEARVNDVLASHQEPAVCVYDLTRLGAQVAMDVLRTHPLVILDGVARENPFFVRPVDFLKELEERTHA
jgi:hypothetical protein